MHCTRAYSIDPPLPPAVVRPDIVAEKQSIERLKQMRIASRGTFVIKIQHIYNCM